MQRTRVNGAMGRYHDLSKWIVTPQDDVTALLSAYVKPRFLKSTNDPAKWEAPGKPAQRAATSTSKMSLSTSRGTGRPSSIKDSM